MKVILNHKTTDRSDRHVMRRAILIGNDRWGGDRLPGVPRDMEAMQSFLLSPAGGAWRSDSIIRIDTPFSKNALIQNLNQDLRYGVEYFFIYFSGHGELSRQGAPKFVLPGGDEIELNEIKAVLATKPVLMIADSCQGVPEYGAGGILTESRRMFSTGTTYEVLEARRMFDSALRRLPPMFTFASAVSPGEYANDSDLGGLYTYNLLQACRQTLKTEPGPQVIGICYPHMLAARAVEAATANNQDGPQLPSITGYNRTFQPPFLVKL